MKTVYVGIPSYRGYRGWHKFAKGLLELSPYLPPGSEIQIEEYGEGTSAARNAFTRDFMEKEHTHILYMDDDEIPQPDAVLKMLRLRKPVVTGLVPRCNRPNMPPIGDFFEKDEATGTLIARNLIEFPWDKPFEVDWCGSGFLLVERSVFDKLEEPYWKKEYKPHYCSEDMRFSLMLREAGIPITVDPRCHVAHIRGGYVYTMQDFKRNLRMGEVWTWERDSRYHTRV